MAINRSGGIPEGAEKLGYNFYLFKGTEKPDRLIINAHGSQTIFKSKTTVPDGMIANFFTEHGKPLLYDLKHGAKGGKFPIIESLTGEINNYRISRANEGGYYRTHQIASDYGVDILMIRNRRLGFNNLTLDDAFKKVRSRNYNYKILDVPICRDSYFV